MQHHRSRPCRAAGACIGILLLVACFTHLRAQERNTEVSFSLTDPVYTLGAPVFLEFELRNASNDVVRADLGENRQGTFAISVTSPGGTTTPQVSLPLVGGLQRSGDIVVSPGGSHRQRLLLNKWVDFPDIGVYLVEVTMINPVWDRTGRRVPMEPFRTQVRILPRNEVRLRETCERLATEIENSISVEFAVEAAEALGHVRENLAVPYLKRALESRKYVESQVVGALERIGTREAVDVLIALLEEAGQHGLDASTQLGTRAILSRQALDRLALSTTDPELRWSINEAITGP